MSASPTTARGPYAKSRKLRASIAGAVLTLVEEVGHEAVNTPLVAARTGVAEATVLYHFPTRDHLLVAALQFVDDQSMALVSGELDLERLRLAASRPHGGSERITRLHVMLRGQSATPNHPAAEYFQLRTKRSVEVFTQLVADMQARGTAHPGIDAGEAATQITAIWEGLAAIWTLDHTLDIGTMLINAVRRIVGQNVMELRDAVNRPDLGV